MKKKYLAVILTAVLLLGTVPEAVFAEPAESEDGLVIEKVTPVGEPDEQKEPIAYTKEGEPIYGGYIGLSSDLDVPELKNEELENELLTSAEVPEVYNPKASDWSGSYTLPEIRNQEPYSTCWTFGALAAAEMSLLTQYGENRDLSELQLAYFAYHGSTDPLGGRKVIK